jgi:hypothetical protein
MADETTQRTESRVASLEVGLHEVRREVSSLKETLTTALLGDYDGKPGMRQLLNNSLEASRVNSEKLDNLSVRLNTHGSQLDGLRLDRAKVAGIVVTCSILWAVLATSIGVLLRLWK